MMDWHFWAHLTQVGFTVVLTFWLVVTCRWVWVMTEAMKHLRRRVDELERRHG